ncbi:kinase-like domain-containing protein, partial [Endogone sp. FLAS-F59071]
MIIRAHPTILTFNLSPPHFTLQLNDKYDKDDRHHILRLIDTFIHRRHLCLVFELLSVNLYELIKQNQFRGLSTNLVRVFTAQLLDALTVLNEANIIHCDLKPENVLLKNLESPTIKVIDFGSACHEAQTVYTYIQSRFYRSPEVLLGLPYTSRIDMWSLGCIAAELFLGLPLFPGSSEYNQISRIVEMLGTPPAHMLEVGKNALDYFDRAVDPYGRKTYRLKDLETYSRERNVQEQPSKKYFAATKLPDIVNTYPVVRRGLSPKEQEREMQNRRAFIDFLQGLLNLNPIERWSPQQANMHPFITGAKFTGPFVPPVFPAKAATSVAPNVVSTATSPMVTSAPNSPPVQSPSGSSYHSSSAMSSVVNSPQTAPSSVPHGKIPEQQVQQQSLVAALQTLPTSNTNTLMPPVSKYSTGTTTSGSRPRANTIGTMQAPPQIQRLAKAVSPSGAAGAGVSGAHYDSQVMDQLSSTQHHTHRHQPQAGGTVAAGAAMPSLSQASVAQAYQPQLSPYSQLQYIPEQGSGQAGGSAPRRGRHSHVPSGSGSGGADKNNGYGMSLPLSMSGNGEPAYVDFQGVVVDSHAREEGWDGIGAAGGGRGQARGVAGGREREREHRERERERELERERTEETSMPGALPADRMPTDRTARGDWGRMRDLERDGDWEGDAVSGIGPVGMSGSGTGVSTGSA